MNKTIWLLSAYSSASHASWADWLINTFSEFQWRRLELPGRHFRWRIRGNPLSWLYRLPEKTPDLILATSMVDLATLKGLHPRLAGVPCIYYFHENQFAYPVSAKQFNSVDPQMVHLYGAIASDWLLFNSCYNRDSFLQGVAGLLQKLPDEVPGGIVEALAVKSTILPVVVTPVTAKQDRSKGLILWNHRWEYDKQPQLFCDALFQLNEIRQDFQLALLGGRPVKKPDALQQIEAGFADRIIVNDKVSRAQYHNYLAQSAIVVSTAIHEFQGLSVMEAVSAGTVPLVPDDLCYREQYADEYRYKPGDCQALVEKLDAFLDHAPPAPDISYWHSGELIDNWYQVLKDI